MKKLTVTIGIPAYNEENHIFTLLQSLLKQSALCFKLDKIILYSDCSSDKTVAVAKSIKSQLIKIVSGKVRKGKPAGMNAIFKIARSDVVVILDADLKLSDNFVINNLVSPLVTNHDLSITSGLARPLPPKNKVQQIAKKGIEIWDEVISTTPNTHMYHCSGPIRAFRKSLYKKLEFPNTSADDVYPYIYCSENGYKFHQVTNTQIYYQLPATLDDYIKQTSRFQLSPIIQEQNFSPQIVKKYFTITFFDKTRVAILHLFKDPIATLPYVMIDLFTKVRVALLGLEDQVTWEIISSTKKVV
jgi:glycosyltransferase involved in cell wall biosynthesis